MIVQHFDSAGKAHYFKLDAFTPAASATFDNLCKYTVRVLHSTGVRRREARAVEKSMLQELQCFAVPVSVWEAAAEEERLTISADRKPWQ